MHQTSFSVNKYIHRRGWTDRRLYSALTVIRRSHRTTCVAKYNQLMRIEDELFITAMFAGQNAFYNLKNKF